MRDISDTPACQARLLHHTVKTFVAEMEKEGFSQEASYVVLLNVVMRLAFEQRGDAGVEDILHIMEKLSGLERPQLKTG